MNNTLIKATMAISILAAGSSEALADNQIIERPEFKSQTGLFDIDALQALGRVSSPVVSPDGKKILFGISYESVEQNKSNNELYVVNTDASGLTRLTETAQSENGAVWFDNGNKIAFLAAVDGKQQLWVMNSDGSNRQQVSKLEKGVEAFVISPDESKIILVSTIKFERTPQDIYPDLPLANAHIVDDLMYKHWDEWVTDIPHP
ncbi:MAG: peptidase S9, partial [Muribaculaceae bacterium]|nr:peptidase S9 [Muribaculaceae bacterium]